MSVALEPADTERFRDLVRQHLGLDFDDAKLTHLADVLRARMAAGGRSRARAYLDALADRGRDEWRVLAQELTVTETFFFRYRDHFRAFAEVVLPDCLAVARPHRPLRVLSAGSASGEEAYTVAILVREHLPAATEQDVRIVGVDVNAHAVERARHGRYSAWSLRETPADVRERYFRAEGRHFVLHDEIRSTAAFEERNLLVDDGVLWRPGAFDVVFCRNVLMYLTPEAMRSVVARISRALRPGGFLFLGHAETLRSLSSDYHLEHTHDTFYYRLRGALERRDVVHRSADGAPGAWAQTPAPVAGALGLDDSSWIDAIGRASERVAALTERPARAASAPASLDRTQDRRAHVDRPALFEMMRQERFSEALSALRDVPETHPADLGAHLLRAVLLTNSGRLADAEQACRGLLAIDELSAGAHYLMALCREHAGDRAAAIEHDRSAAYLEPGFAMARLHLGLLERRAGRFAQARAALTLALNLLATEDPSRILIFGGGFDRGALMAMCRSELRLCGGQR